MPDRRRHVMRLPEVVVVGEDLVGGVGEELKRMFGRCRVLLVTGPSVGRLYGERVARSLGGEGFTVITAVARSPSVGEAERILAETGGADIIIGVGGGRPIDIAKYVAYRLGAAFVSVPTSAAHDGIASPFASLRDSGRPYSMVTNPPRMIIADVRVIESAPPRLIRSGAGDLLAKETAVLDWRLARDERSEYYGEYSAQLALLSARVVADNAWRIGSLDREGVRTLVEALISAGVAAGIAGSSRPCSGSEHLISHALDLVAPGKGLHGEKTGLATMIAARLHGADWRRIREVLESVGAPTSFSSIGVTREELCRAMVMAPGIRPERYTILHKLSLGYEDSCSLVDELGLA